METFLHDVSALIARIKSLDIPGYSGEEISFMEEILVNLRPTIVFDWGTNRGSSARIFYEASKIHEYPCEIHTTDLPDEVEHIEHPHKGFGFFVRDLSDVYLHRGDGVQVSLAIYQEKCPERALFFVDGDHSYNTVRRELLAISEIAPDATILCHDVGYEEGEVRRAFRDFVKSHPTYSVKILPYLEGIQAGLGLLIPLRKNR
jgi:hypothetical protein